MHFEIMNKEQKNLYEKLKVTDFLNNFYLAGETGLALQIGHRKSEDLDFFTANDFEVNTLTFELQTFVGFNKLSESKNTLYGISDGIKMSFIGFKYRMISDFLKDGKMKIAGIKDIAAMKLSAVTQRSTKKDFTDIYYLLKRYTLKELFEMYKIKFDTETYEYVLKKSLIYFEEAEAEPMPLMTNNINWNEIKSGIEKSVFEQ